MSRAKYRVYICVGPNCGPKGSARLSGTLEIELAQLNLEEDVSITMGGCQSHCETGPTMVVYPGPVFYEHIDRDRLRRIAREHLANDTPVPEFFWDKNRPPRKIIPGNPATGSFDTSILSRQNPDSKPRKPKPSKVYDVDDFKW